MDKALIIGAGAIGRGFLPFCLNDSFDLVFYDSNSALVDSLNSSVVILHTFL